MAEKHRCEAPEGHLLCANNCGFFGSPATMNLCSKCYGDFRLKEQQEASTKSTIEAALSASSPSQIEPLSAPHPPPLPLPPITLPEEAEDFRSPGLITDVSEPQAVANKTNRCTVCRKRVGLTGFRCKCGTTFCGAHRYPEKHGCTFDFKTVGRDQIARANPLVKADKLEKI